MQRNLGELAGAEYDVLVIGGGISGACVAWDAAQRGLRVALIEREDFGGATSANSLKTVHGGLRYLQDGDLRLVRRMINERKALLRIAPHLVRPLPVLMPTFRGAVLRSKLVLGAAAQLADVVGFDRNRGLEPQQALPGSRLLSRSACLQTLPGLDHERVTGAVVWHDAQIYNSERLTLAFLQSAARAGARLANYVAATSLLQSGRRMLGAAVCDELTGASFAIRARVVVNTAGRWVDQVLGWVSGPAPAPRFHPSLAVNLVTRQVFRDYAVGLSSAYTETQAGGATRSRSQVLFIVPWRNCSLIGTRHMPGTAGPGGRPVPEALIHAFLEQVNQAYPPLGLRPADVYRLHAGYLPAVPELGGQSEVKLIRASQVHDHAAQDELDGLVTVVGVKYTTARAAAERAVDLVFQKLGRPSPPCQTRRLPLYGGQPARASAALQPAVENARRHVPSDSLQALLRNHGSECHQVLRYVALDPDWGRPLSSGAAVLRAEVIHAVRSEMACRLGDVVLRRTDLGSAGPPQARAVEACADIMATALGWDHARRQREIDAVWQHAAAFGVGAPGQALAAPSPRLSAELFPFETGS